MPPFVVAVQTASSHAFGSSWFVHQHGPKKAKRHGTLAAKLVIPVVAPRSMVTSATRAPGFGRQSLLVARFAPNVGSFNAPTLHGIPTRTPSLHIPLSPTWGSWSATTHTGHGLSTVNPVNTPTRRDVERSRSPDARSTVPV